MENIANFTNVAGGHPPSILTLLGQQVFKLETGVCHA